MVVVVSLIPVIKFITLIKVGSVTSLKRSDGMSGACGRNDGFNVFIVFDVFHASVFIVLSTLAREQSRSPKPPQTKRVESSPSGDCGMKTWDSPTCLGGPVYSSRSTSVWRLIGEPDTASAPISSPPSSNRSRYSWCSPQGLMLLFALIVSIG